MTNQACNERWIVALKIDLELEGSLDNRQFGIYSDYGEGDDVYFIKANKGGLKLFAY